MGPNRAEHVKYFATNELTANVTYLGQYGHIKTGCGITIAYFSGIEAEKASNSHEFDVTTYQDMLLSASAGIDARGVDILITSQWPKDVQVYDAAQPESGDVPASPLISKLATVLRPRYHFAGLAGIHYERLPYRYSCKVSLAGRSRE